MNGENYLIARELVNFIPECESEKDAFKICKEVSRLTREDDDEESKKIENRIYYSVLEQAKIVKKMLAQGNGFIINLAKAIQSADKEDRQRIFDAFSDVIRDYHLRKESRL